MKKYILFIVLICSICSSLIAQNLYEKPKLDHKDSWSVIFIPDIQNYVKFGRNQPILELMTSWIEENIDTLNIKMVICAGDLVEQNERINRGKSGNQSGCKQWEAAAKAFGKLDGKVPYITATGNHDYSYDLDGVRRTKFNSYFPIDKNFLNRKHICQNTLNVEGKETMENSAFELKSQNGRDFLFMTLEFAPRDTVVKWAKNIADMPQYKNHCIVLLTHEFLNAKGERTSGKMHVTTYLPYYENGDIKKKKIYLPDANKGQDLWEKLIYPASNIGVVLCGHISGESFRVDRNNKGKRVNQMLFNAQSMGGGHYGNGGDGWLRILEFYPDNKTVSVKTFSPLFSISPSTQFLAWKKGEKDEFIFQLD